MANPQRERGYTAIANEIMEALAHTRIAGEAHQVLDFILRKTYGFNKKEDSISLSQFYLGTGLKTPAVCRAINHLLEMNLIIKNDNGKITKYRFNKDFSTWKPLSKKRGVSHYCKSATLENDNPLLSKMRDTKVDITKVDNTKETYPFLKDSFFKDLWEGWLEVRRKLRAPNTDRALDLALKKLHSYPIDEAKRMVEQSIERGWRGIFPYKQDFKGKTEDNIPLRRKQHTSLATPQEELIVIREPIDPKEQEKVDNIIRSLANKKGVK